MWHTKPIILFRNGGDQSFGQICLGDEIFRKSRQVWTEIVNKACDEINKGFRKFNDKLEKIIIP